jgi:hypothetical protein
MKLYLTGASFPEEPQMIPANSLGGFKSSTEVLLQNPNNLFSDISYLSKINGYAETRGFILKNDSGVSQDEVLVNYVYPQGAQYKMEIAVVELVNNNQMESIMSGRDTPYYAVFGEHNKTDTVDNSFSVGAMPIDKCIGIWMRVTPINAPKTDQQLYEASLL